ncbi:MAG: AsmA family protein [Magnetospirillum sp. WYHS-4]
MKSKILIGLGLVVVLLVGTALVAPSFIDWNQHRALATRMVKEATGRDLVIGGDMTLSVLPKPAVLVNDLRLSNLPGAHAPQMMSLKTLEVRIALAPLLAGNVQIERVRVVDPVIEIETLADGRSNLAFEGLPSETAPSPAAPASGGGEAKAGGGFDLQLDNLTLENGTVVYRDTKAGTVEKIEEINASVAIASLAGPVEAKGSLRARGIPLSVNGTVGKLIHGRTVPLDLALGLGAGNSTVKVSGTLVGLETTPGFKGKVEAKGDDLAALLRGVAGTNDLPAFLGRNFGFSGNVAGSQTEVSVPDLTMNLGDTQASGNLSVALGAIPTMQANLNVGRIDLDALMAGMTSAPSAPPAPVKGQAPVASSAPGKAASQAFALPANVNAAIRLGIEALSYKGGVIRQAKLNADLANGEVTLSQLSAQLPGSTDVALFGFVSAKNGKPQLEGEMEISAADLRAVLSWLGVALPADLPKERLRRLAYKSAFVATPDQVQIAGLAMQMDGTNVSGGATVKLGSRPAFGADLVADKVNLDGYLPAAAAQPKGGSSGGAKGEGGAAAPAPSAAPGGMTALKGFDANVKLAVKSLTYRQTPISDLVVDGTLHNGNLDLRRLAVGQAAGASLAVKGGLLKLDGLPEMKDLHVDFLAADLAPVFRLAGLEAPAQAKGLGRVTLRGKASGQFLKPALDMSLQAAGATLDLNGSVSALPAPTFDARVAVKHGDLVQLARTLGVDYRPAGRLGGTDLALHVKGGLDKMALSDIKGSLGPVSLSGSANLDLSGAKPKVGAQLATGELPVDRFLPAQRTASLPGEGEQGVKHAGGKFRPLFQEALERPVVLAAAPGASRPVPQATAGGAVDPRWSRDPLDLSALASVDADVILRSAAIVFQDYRFDNADIALALAGGVLRTQRVTGTLFGGAVQANATVDANKGAKADLSLQVANLDVGRAVAAAAGKGMAGGAMNLDLKAATQGGSVAQLVQALAGNGSLTVKGLDVKKEAQGSALSALLDLVGTLNTLGGTLGGGKSGSGLADVSGTFTIDRGIVTSRDARLISGVGNGTAIATVDLPRWTIDSQGKVDLAQNLLTQVLTQKTGVQNTSLPFSITGRLDAPNVKLDTASLPGKGIAIPGTEKLLKKKGVGTLLETVLPGATGGAAAPAPQQPTAPTQAPQQQQPQQQQVPTKPKDILKGILLGR